MAQSKRRIILYLLALVMAFGAAGCSVASASEKTQSGTRAAGKPEVNDNQIMLDYLKTARGELTLIDEITADKDIGLLEEETDSEEELTAEQVEKYEKILSGYTDRIQTVLKDIDSRTAPDQPDIVNFQTSEKAAFQTLDSILQEYSQTLSYAGTLLMVKESFASLSIQETDDLQAIYDAFSASIGDAIAALEAEDVPSFVESYNQDFIDILKELDDAVYDMLSAQAVDDPVRTDAAGYLVEILQRRADEIGQKGMQDMADRVRKLSTDAQAVVTTCSGLKSWVDTNIGNFDGQREGE
jgi:hypothetical protein